MWSKQNFRRGIAWLALLLLAALALLPVGVARAESDDGDIAKSCAFLSPEDPDRVKKLLDGSVKTFVTLRAGQQVRLNFPEPVQGVYLEWFELPAAFTMDQLTAEGSVLCTETVTEPGLNRYYPMESGAGGLAIYGEGDLTLATLRVYPAGPLPESLQRWEPPAGKCDLLLISAHCDDELLYFGGTIPTYAGERGCRVQLAYMAHGNRLRQNEAMDGLWLCGVRNEPIFLGFRDSYSESLKTAERQWGREKVLTALTALIRRTKPEVIITHDLEGEYGHGAHRITASCVQEAVALAADPSAEPSSLTEYGAWQVKKLYLHLYPENALLMDWRVPLAAFNGKTALDMANEAYLCHASQLDYHTAVHDAGDDNCAAFGLAFTAVGPDEEKDDFLEHIDPADLTGYVPPTPAPTQAPTPAPTPVPTNDPAPTASPEPAPPAKPFPWTPVGIACALIPVVAGALLLAGRKKR